MTRSHAGCAAHVQVTRRTGASLRPFPSSTKPTRLLHSGLFTSLFSLQEEIDSWIMCCCNESLQ